MANTYLLTDQKTIGNNFHVVVHEPDKSYLNHREPYRHPILAIHGMWGTSKRWSKYAEFFQKRGFHFVSVNLRHHYLGNNDSRLAPRFGKTSVEYYVNDVMHLINAMQNKGLVLGNTKTGPLPLPIIFGHSMGGLIAQRIASFGLAERLVLLNSAPPAGIKLHADIGYQIAIARYLPWVLLEKPFKPSFAIYARYVINGMPKDQHKQLYEGVVYESGRATKEIRFGKITVDFSKITCPTLVVGCAKDRIVPPQVASEIYKKMLGQPSSRAVSYRTYQDFAHWILTEPGWEKPAQDIFEWLTETK